MSRLREAQIRTDTTTRTRIVTQFVRDRIHVRISARPIEMSQNVLSAEPAHPHR